MGLFSKSRDWYKNAVFYALDVKTYMDSDGDGIGDFKGLISRLDHIKMLGVDCIWLLPFFPSPLRDNGYDVSDYYNVDPRLGTMAEFEEFMREASRRDLKVMIDLVINHTSDQHPWFTNARSSRDAEFRHFYVWHETPDHNEVKVDFDHAETSVWEHSAETDMYYLHRFYKEQPDLNLSDPDVQKEITKIMDFWIDKGVCSYRIDAAHMITDPVEIENTDYQKMHELFGRMRRHLEKRIGDGVLLAEANVGPEQLPDYFTDGEEGDARMHMLFNFIANKYTMLAFARRDGRPLIKGLNKFRPVNDSHWVNFIRHHDELNTDMLDEQERDDLFKAFAPEERMRALDGVRRRLPPMLGNDRRRVELMFKVVFSLPGAPLINYGEEIGMGDDLSLEGRFAVRTPMQWSNAKNGGFSTADKEDLYVPVIDHGEYGYQDVNVESQLQNKNSQLGFVRDLIALRKEHPVIGNGSWSLVITDTDRVAAILFEDGKQMLLVVHNLAEEDLTVKLFPGFTPKNARDVGKWDKYGKRIDLQALELKGYGSRWIELKGRVEETIN